MQLTNSTPAHLGVSPAQGQRECEPAQLQVERCELDVHSGDWTSCCLCLKQCQRTIEQAADRCTPACRCIHWKGFLYAYDMCCRSACTQAAQV